MNESPSEIEDQVWAERHRRRRRYQNGRLQPTSDGAVLCAIAPVVVVLSIEARYFLG